MKTKSREEIFSEYATSIFILGFGAFCLLASIIFQSRAGYIRLSIENNFSNMSIFMLGILNSLNIYDFMHESRGDRSNSFFLAALEMVGYFLMSCGFFNVVLIPFSGFGLVEIFVVLIYFFGNFLTGRIRPKKINFTERTPFSTFCLGLFLLLIKVVVFYLLDDNIYLQFVEGNTVLRSVIFVISIGGAFSILTQLSKVASASLGVTHSRNRNKKNTGENFFVKVGTALVAAVKNLVMFVLSIFSSSWIGILIFLVLLLIVFGVGIFAVDSIFKSVMRIVEPLIQKFLSTGEYSVNPSVVYSMGQLVAFGIYSLFIFYIKHQGKTNVEYQCEELLENFVLNDESFSGKNRLALKNRVIQELSYEKNEIKKIALASDKEELKRIAKTVSQED